MSSTVGWDCPKCDRSAAVDPLRQPGTPMHVCPGLHMMTVPFRLAGSDSDVRLVEREDYVRHEDVRTDDEGRPWMAADVIRADGSNDRVVYAPTAHLDQRT
jgi:hypothetical protein